LEKVKKTSYLKKLYNEHWLLQVEELSVLADEGLRELLADYILPETDPYYARSAGVANQLLRANSGVVSFK
jgi:hypothetical protein